MRKNDVRSIPYLRRHFGSPCLLAVIQIMYQTIMPMHDDTYTFYIILHIHALNDTVILFQLVDARLLRLSFLLLVLLLRKLGFRQINLIKRKRV